jgi:ATP-dependent Clp protease ATP-binding subunit ClpX
MINPKIQVTCSFCKKFQSEVHAIIKAERIFICNECVALCSDMISKFNIEQKRGNLEILYPKQIREKLDQEIVGQEHAKQIISVAAFMHTLRINTGQGAKSNILLIGPTGSGKTRMMQVLGEILGVPLAIADATTLTEAGYVGDDVESIISRLLQAADYNVERAQQGIIYIDEIDKIARTSENRSISRDVSGEGVQQGLLKLIEGTLALVPQKYNIKHPSQDMVQINTKDILFICGGAFDGLDKIIRNRFRVSKIGIDIEFDTNNNEQIMDFFDSHDLVKFGLIPELVGRLPIKAIFNHLNLEDYIRIITEPKSSIFNQYRALLANISAKLSITEDAVRAIAEESIKRKTGARGIRSVFEDVFLPIVYEIENSQAREICITSDIVQRSVKVKKESKTAFG